LTLLWSGKESVLKALRTGLRLDTRCVIVSPLDATLREDREGCIENPAFTFRTLYGLNSWCPLQVRYTNGQIFHGWWQYTGSLLQTLVAAPPPGPPILLKTTT
jgi:4'-phosphopantetheinyl transferase